MIKLTRPSEPRILCDNSATWTRDIMNLVAKYGTYKEIPPAEKEAALKFYRHDDIRNTLKESSFHKIQKLKTRSLVNVSKFLAYVKSILLKAR